MPPSRILIVDTSVERFQVYQRILEAQKFEVHLADKAEKTLGIFIALQPSLVILDLAICVHNQCDLISQIKQHDTGEEFVPILLASDENENKLIQHSLAQKADGFLNIPYSEEVLLTKVHSLLRIRNLYVALKDSRDKIYQLHTNLEQEHKDAERIYEKFVRPSSQNIVGFKSYISPASIFNGDLLLARIQPSGDVLILLGDFTGHGLSAAIGVIPVAEMFNGMVVKARSVPEIIVEINAKLHKILPAHLFFSCAVIQLSPSQKKARIFNCGMPDVLMTRPGEDITRFSSRNLPLGIVDSKRLDLYPDAIKLDGRETFYLLTDGVIESRNPAGEMFGYKRVEQVLLAADENTESGGGVDALIKHATEFCDGQFFQDDISIASLQTAAVLSHNYIDTLEKVSKSAKWKLHYQFDHQSLKQMERPMEGVVDAIMVVQAIPSHKERLFIILDELFNNALDHGVLKLDSSIKQQPDGFLKYLHKRQFMLEHITDGSIELQIHHTPLTDYEGEFSITVTDNGDGFDYESSPQNPGQDVFSGRGIMLTRSLCESVTYQGKGNVVTAVYRWNLRPQVD